MARHLGLSVHTINDRLRDARRKMSASSSREAARQLRALEREGPENLGDRLLGDAVAPGMEQLRASAETRRMSRRAGWIVGAIIMSVSLALFALASLSGNAGTPAAAPSTAPAASPAVAAARDWLALVDKRDWNGSWGATGQRSEEHTSELQSLMRISYAVFCLKKQ